jgi:hypothetical protein
MGLLFHIWFVTNITFYILLTYFCVHSSRPTDRCVVYMWYRPCQRCHFRPPLSSGKKQIISSRKCLDHLQFQQYIIMAMHAKPVPADPYNPMPPLPASRPGENEVVRHPSPFVPIRIPIFALVIWLNDGIVRVLNAIAGRPVVRHRAAARSRSFSNASESAEDGVSQMERKPFRGSGTSSTTAAAMGLKPMGRPPNERVKISTRRKHD